MGSPLPYKSAIGQAADQATFLLFPPRTSVLYFNSEVIRKRTKLVHRAPLRKVVSIHKHCNGVRLAGSSVNRKLDGRNHVTQYLVT